MVEQKKSSNAKKGQNTHNPFNNIHGARDDDHGCGSMTRGSGRGNQDMKSTSHSCTTDMNMKDMSSRMDMNSNHSRSDYDAFYDPIFALLPRLTDVSSDHDDDDFCSDDSGGSSSARGRSISESYRMSDTRSRCMRGLSSIRKIYASSFQVFFQQHHSDASSHTVMGTHSMGNCSSMGRGSSMSGCKLDILASLDRRDTGGSSFLPDDDVSFPIVVYR